MRNSVTNCLSNLLIVLQLETQPPIRRLSGAVSPAMESVLLCKRITLL
jgi:hypothetical protein